MMIRCRVVLCDLRRNACIGQRCLEYCNRNLLDWFWHCFDWKFATAPQEHIQDDDNKSSTCECIGKSPSAVRFISMSDEHERWIGWTIGNFFLAIELECGVIVQCDDARQWLVRIGGFEYVRMRSWSKAN